MAFYGRRTYRRRGARRSSYGAYKRGFRASNYKRNWGRIKRGTPEGIAMFGETEKIAKMPGNEKMVEARKALGIRGRGAYFDEFGKNSHWLSGNTMNINTGSMGGRGAYVTNDKINGAPNQDEKAIVIQNSEYIQDITSTGTGFTTLFTTPINPGLSNLLPWLSQIAQFYENYEFIQLFFEFRSMVTDGNATAAGNVIMATQSNPLAADFTSKQVMENYNGSKSCKVTDSLMFGIECDPRKIPENALNYVRRGGVPTGEDPKTYDLSKIQICVSGVPNGLTLGELWVHYKVKFVTPKVTIVADPYATVRLAIAASTDKPFGATSQPQLLNIIPGLITDNIGILYNTPNANNFTFTFPANGVQRYLIRYYYVKSSALIVGTYAVSCNNGTVLSSLRGDDVAFVGNAVCQWVLIQTNQTGTATVNFNITTINTSYTQINIESCALTQTL